MNQPSALDLSIVVPLYNEEGNVHPLHERLCGTLEHLDRTYEIIFVDDGSQDGTSETVRQLIEQDPHLVLVVFCRNYGQTAAMAAGFEISRGQVIVPMDGDLQNDPDDIPKLLAVLDEGYDVVSGWRKNRQDKKIRVLPSRVANLIISKVSGVKLHDYGCSLKAYRREVLDGVNLYGEMHRFIPIYATWQGAKVTEIAVNHHPRVHGQSKYGFDRMLKVMLDLIVVKFFSSYLTKPIYVFGTAGVSFIMLSLCSFMLALFFKLVPVDNPWGPQWHKNFNSTPLPELSAGLFVVGVQTILIGLLAEMTMRTYYESQGKRAYRIRTIHRNEKDSQ